MPREKMGGENLQCMLCTSKPPPDVLRKHIKSQHLIVKESAVDKIYAMHFPKEVVSIDTQTTMTWIDQLEDLEQSIASIAENVEKVSETSAQNTRESTKDSKNLDECKAKTVKHSLTSMPESDLEDEKMPEFYAPSHDEMLNPEYDLTLSPTTSEIGANPDVPEPRMASPSDEINTPEPEEEAFNLNPPSNNLLHSGSFSISKIDEDDDPVIIREKKVDYSDATYSMEQSMEMDTNEDDDPVIIEQKKADLFDSDSSSSSVTESPDVKIKDMSMEQEEVVTNQTHEEIKKVEEEENEEIEEEENKESNVPEKCTTWVRYRCPYCDFVDFKKYVVDDHVIIQHADAQYGEAKKQELYVGIERDPSLSTLLKVHYKNYDIPDIMIDDEDNSKEDVILGDFSEVNDEIASNIEESFLEDEPEWQPSDATLPIGWLFNESTTNDGNMDIFMSPCKRKFSSRDQVAEFLMDQGKKIIRAGGFKVPDAGKSKCDAMCEGNCKLFVVPKSFYHPKDKNKIRKKTKLKFINEKDVAKANRTKDKMVKGVPKFKLVQGVRYKKASKKVTRPWLLLIEESDIQQSIKTKEPEKDKGKPSTKVEEKEPLCTDSIENVVPSLIEKSDVKSVRASRKSIENTQKENNKEDKSIDPIETDKDTLHIDSPESSVTPAIKESDLKKSARTSRRSIASKPKEDSKESKIVDPVEKDLSTDITICQSSEIKELDGKEECKEKEDQTEMETNAEKEDKSEKEAKIEKEAITEKESKTEKEGKTEKEDKTEKKDEIEKEDKTEKKDEIEKEEISGKVDTRGNEDKTEKDVKRADEEKAVPSVETPKTKKSLKTPRKSVAVTPLKESPHIAILDKDEHISAIASVSKSLALDTLDKEEKVSIKEDEIKRPPRITRKSTGDTSEVRGETLQDATTAKSPLKDAKEMNNLSPVKKVENKRGSRATRKSIVESSSEEIEKEPQTETQDAVSSEQNLVTEQNEKEILPEENVDLKKNSTVETKSIIDEGTESDIFKISEIMKMTEAANEVKETPTEGIHESLVPESSDAAMETSTNKDEFTVSFDDNETMDTTADDSKEIQISDPFKETKIQETSELKDVEKEKEKEQIFHPEKVDKLSTEKETSKPYINTDEIEVKPASPLIVEPEVEKEEIFLLNKTPAKKQEQKIQETQSSSSTIEKFSAETIQGNDVNKEVSSSEEKHKSDEIISEPIVSSKRVDNESNIKIEAPKIETNAPEFRRDSLGKSAQEKDLSFMQMEDESQQENEIVIIPAKSVTEKPSEYKTKIDVPGVIGHSEDSEIDKLKESEMISMVNLKESSLVELKLDDIEKVFASTNVGKNKEEADIKLKEEGHIPTNIGSIHVEKAKVPCNINIEEVNLVPEVKNEEMGQKHQTSSEMNIQVKDEQTNEKSLMTSKRRRSQESTSRTESPASKKRRQTFDEENIAGADVNIGSGISALLAKKLHRPVKDMSSESEIKKLIGSKIKTTTMKNESDSDQEQNVKKNIEKLKRLQKKELEINKNEGTYVQCCTDTCLKWRLVREFEDPSMVPEYWTCSMNSDSRNNICGVGGHAFMSDAETVDVKFTCGSMVWAKMKGFPWWPGMVDYCPDCEEYYWIEEDISLTEPAWYNVVFFEGKGNSVSRAWVKKDDIMKITLPAQPPKNTIKSATTKTKLTNAIKMATDAKLMTREARLEKYSFAALFRGKWGAYVDLESDSEENPAKKKKLIKKVGNEERKVKSHIKEKFITDAGLTSSKVSAIKKELVLKSTPDTASYDPRENQSETRPEDDNPIPSTSKDGMDREPLKFVYKKDGPEKKMKVESSFGKPIKKSHWEVSSSDSSYSKPSSPSSTLIAAQGSRIVSPKKSTILGNLKYVNKALEDAQKIKYAQEAKEDEFILKTNPHLDKNHPKPPLPSDVLIALAVRNLDPNNHYGASFRSIIAFLTLHFPYFNRNVEECKDMVRRAYDINSREETGKENFRIKSTLVEQLSVRIKSYVERSKGMVKQAMLQAEFLDTIVERFVHGTKSNPACNFRPPYSCKMLSYLALVSICPPCSIEQIMIFITFLFPSLQNDKTAFKKEDFENAIRNDDNVEEFYLPPNGQRMFILREGSYPIVLNSVRQFFGTKSNNIRLKKSIYKQEFVNILLPNLITEDDPVDTEMK